MLHYYILHSKPERTSREKVFKISAGPFADTVQMSEVLSASTLVFFG